MSIAAVKSDQCSIRQFLNSYPIGIENWRIEHWSDLLSSFLFGSRTGEDTCHSVIPFVTGVLVKRCRYLFHGNFAGPGFRPRRRIVDRELIEERVFIGACEAFDDTQFLTRSSETRFVAEIRGFDDKGFTFPMTARIPHQRAHILRNV